LRREKNYSDALSAISNAIRIDPEYAWAYGVQGDIYYSKEKYNNAILSLAKAIFIDSSYTWARVKLAESFLKTGNLQNAMVQYKTAILTDSYNTYPYVSLRDSLHVMHLDSLAIRVLRDVAKELPDHLYPPQYISFISHEYLNYNQDAFETAYKIDKKLFEENPTDYNVLQNFVENNFTTARYSECIKLGKKALKGDATDLDRLHMEFFISSAYFLEGKAKEGEENLYKFQNLFEQQPYGNDNWIFNGTRRYIETLNNSKEKDICMAMLNLMENKISIEAFKKMTAELMNSN
jgi:tetratricopeptide (TPR) repeat protein